MASGDIYSLRYEIGVAGRRTTNTLWYKQISSDPTDSSPTQLLNSFDFSATAALRAVIADECTLCTYLVTPKSTADPPAQQIFGGTAGLGGSNVLPSNKAWVLSLLQTTLPARHNGRIYVPGLSQENQDGNVLTPVFRDGAATTFRDAIGPTVDDGDPLNGEYELGVYTIHSVPFNPAEVVTSTGRVVKPQVFSQRPRQTRLQRVQ